MDEVETLKKKIAFLESQIEEERLKHKKTIERVKSENYEALEASQTRYQAELEIQRTNFQRRIEDLNAKLRSFKV
tara:strand:- start:81 stop:305 length:225 start_codon:yes stop_codon:yes gene_type:complete